MGVTETPGSASPGRALCHLVLKQYKEAVKDCTEALKLDGKNVKAFYRRAQAYKALKVRGPDRKAPAEGTVPGGGVCLSPGAGQLRAGCSWGLKSLCLLSSCPCPPVGLLSVTAPCPHPSLSRQDYKSSFADINSLLKIEPRNGPAQKLQQEVNQSLN